MNTNNIYCPQLNVAASTALEAGKIALKFFNRLENLKISEKGINDFVSEADIECEKFITSKIFKSYPDHKITSEEIGSNNQNSEYEWFIDPIDGTTNFIHGIPHFAISIGLCKNDIPIIGVVYDPIKNELFIAEKGKGALLNDKKIRVSNVRSIQSALLGTGIPYRAKDSTGTYINTLKNLMDNKCGGIRRLGAASLDLVYVASGRLDGFWEFNLKPWDVVAGSLIVQESGGIVTDINNDSDFMHSGNILAANLTLHENIKLNIGDSLALKNF